jgi:hypothetical protein
MLDTRLSRLGLARRSASVCGPITHPHPLGPYERAKTIRRGALSAPVNMRVSARSGRRTSLSLSKDLNPWMVGASRTHQITFTGSWFTWLVGSRRLCGSTAPREIAPLRATTPPMGGSVCTPPLSLFRSRSRCSSLRGLRSGRRGALARSHLPPAACRGAPLVASWRCASAAALWRCASCPADDDVDMCIVMRQRLSPPQAYPQIRKRSSRRASSPSRLAMVRAFPSSD